MSDVTDALIADITLDDIESRLNETATVLGAAFADSMNVVGTPEEQLKELIKAGVYIAARTIKDANRAQFLDLATDPGDDDGQEPGFGWLSAKLEGDYNTSRGEGSAATGFVTLTNNGATPHTFKPGGVTVQNSSTGKNYINGGDDAIYIPPAGTYTLDPGTSVTIPIAAVEVGTASNSSPGQIDTIVTALLGVDVTNATSVLGTDREARDKAIRRARLEATRLSLTGPGGAYEAVALGANTDGTLTSEGDGKTLTDVTRVAVEPQNATGDAYVWLASPSGSAISDDVTAVEDCFYNTFTVPAAVTLHVAACVEVPINVTATVYVDPESVAEPSEVEAAILASLETFFSTFVVGRLSMTKKNIEGVIEKRHVFRDIVYDIDMTEPSSDPGDLTPNKVVTYTPNITVLKQ
jgi:phage-related baseplate assembly protein